MSSNRGRMYALPAALAALAAGAPTLTAQDCNLNGIPDACELACGESGGPCDVDGCGESEDCNDNGVPDDCDLPTHDGNGNGIIDSCELVVDRVRPCGRFFLFPAASTSGDIHGALRAFDRSGNAQGVFLEGRIHGASGAVFDATGNLFIALRDDSWLTVVNRNREYVTSIAGGELRGPRGIALDGDGHLAVGSYYSDSVRFFDPDGTYLGELHHQGTVGPQWVVYDRSGNLFVASRNSGAGRVAVFDRERNFVRYIGEGLFSSFPTALAFDKSEHLFATTSDRVVKFSHDGELLSSFSHADLTPHGIALDDTERIFITNANAHEVFVFTTEGVLLDRFAVNLGADQPANLSLFVIAFDALPDTDCNENGTSDACEIEAEDSDCNFNALPDECESLDDCNDNGVQDICDTTVDPSLDCNTNGAIDGCELAAGTVADCNNNGVPDSCDIAGPTSTDFDHNRVPDECQTCAEILPPLSGPLATLKAVAINGEPIEPTNCAAAAPGDIIEAEFFLSGWGPVIGDLRSYQVRILGRRGVSSGQFGLVLPVGWYRPLAEVSCSSDEHCPPDLHCMGHLCVCSSDEDCPPDLICVGGLCVGPNHNPFEGAWLDGARDDFVLAGLEVLKGIGVSTLDYLYFAVGVDVEGVPDLGDARYAGTLLLEVSDDACGRFLFRLHEYETLFVNASATADVVEPYTWPLFIETPSCDCNQNSVRDDEELSAGEAFDCDGDGVLDECEPDCNVNGVPDDCDLAECAGDVWCEDCNSNGVLDECDIADGTLTDADDNGIPDSCFIPIPTVSQWGLVAMTLILLTTSKILFGRRKRTS